MINEQYKKMLEGKSVIRQLSEFATARGKEIGYENVYDYSLGNPSVPVPEEFTRAMIDLLATRNSMELHGYSPSVGIACVKDKIAASLNRRFGMEYTGNHRRGRRPGTCPALRYKAGGRGACLCTLFPGILLLCQPDRR